MKKMTRKEFLEALAKGHMDFEVFGYEGILNALIIADRKLADESEAMGSKTLPAKYREYADTWESILKDRGFYEGRYKAWKK